MRTNIRSTWMAPLLLLGTAIPLHAQGIASQYPGDEGIENDPDVIFVETFEAADLSAVEARWTYAWAWGDAGSSGGNTLVPGGPSGSPGSHVLMMTATGAGEVSRGFQKNLSPGIGDVAYFRFYVKYTGGANYSHAGGRIGGSNGTMGSAGSRPNGTDWFSVAFEPVNFGWGMEETATHCWMDFYNYWMHMRNDAMGPGIYYGNSFIRDLNTRIPLDTWTCVELKVKMNNPLTSFNGEMAVWIDGAPVAEFRPGAPNGWWEYNRFHYDTSSPAFEGFQWRIVDALNINWIILMLYVSQNSPGETSTIWFDHVVLAKKYIGPIGGGGEDDGGTGTVGSSSEAPEDDEKDKTCSAGSAAASSGSPIVSGILLTILLAGVCLSRIRP